METEISEPNGDIVLLSKECISIAKDSNVNIISRIAFLRKYSELTAFEGPWLLVYQVLSSLIHVRPLPGNKAKVDMDSADAATAETLIREYIPTFDYKDLLDNVYSDTNMLISIYQRENNSYFKLQVFRELYEHPKMKVFCDPLDTEWYKYVDETYHVENDYLHFLNIKKFDIVPCHLVEKVDLMIARAKNIS